jgi:hypothetical protein
MNFRSAHLSFVSHRVHHGSAHSKGHSPLPSLKPSRPRTPSSPDFSPINFILAHDIPPPSLSDEPRYGHLCMLLMVTTLLYAEKLKCKVILMLTHGECVIITNGRATRCSSRDRQPWKQRFFGCFWRVHPPGLEFRPVRGCFRQGPRTPARP